MSDEEDSMFEDYDVEPYDEKLDEMKRIVREADEGPFETTGLVSITQLLRDRELGIRGTNLHFARQAKVQFPQKIAEWPEKWRRKIIPEMYEEAEKEIDEDIIHHIKSGDPPFADIDRRAEPFEYPRLYETSILKLLCEECEKRFINIHIPGQNGTYSEVVVFRDVAPARDVASAFSEYTEERQKREYTITDVVKAIRYCEGCRSKTCKH